MHKQSKTYFVRGNPLSKRGRKPRAQASKVFALYVLKSVTSFDDYNNGEK
jgi:hypothetical protein